MNIVDAHHHIWRQADLPWLQGPTQPRIFGRYDPIKRDYPVTEYLEDIASCGIVKSVYVQVNWSPERYLDEARWIEDVSREIGWPHAQVGFADLTVDDARPALDALAEFTTMRGIRQQLHWHENPLYRFASGPDVVRDKNLIANVARLADYGWSFDLQVFDDQMDAAGELVDACSNVPFILQHAGMLEDTSDEGRDKWLESLKRLAGRKDVFCKLSGFGTFIHQNSEAHIQWMIDQSVSVFGADRCLFGSNFPIEKIWTSYSELIASFLHATAGLDAADRRAIFHDNACRIYKI